MQRVESFHAPREACRELSLVTRFFPCQSMCKEECKKRTLTVPCSVLKTCQKTMKKQRQPMSTFFDIDIADYKPQFPLEHPNISHPYGNVSK